MFENFLNYFKFTLSERKGIVVLVVILLGLIVKSYLLEQNSGILEPYDHSAFKAQIELFKSQQIAVEEDSRNEARISDNPPLKISSFSFNPNTFTKKEGELLGIPDKVMNILVNYREKGGVFETKEDLKKIYGLEDSLFERIYPFIQLNSKDSTVLDNVKIVEEVELIIVDINSANQKKLMLVKGIGEVFSKRIIDYREKLGGFINKEQLLAVFGMDQERFKSIESQLTVGEVNPRQININTASAKELIQHPYITSWNEANAIVKYREAHGHYKKIEELKNIHLIDSAWVDQLKPYLSIHESPE